MKYILNWLKSHAGKASISLVQAAGLTAVVGAAGFAAYNYLSSPADNNSFMPPSVYENGNVVYVASGGGGGTYAANGAVQGSAENIRRSRALDLANQQASQYQQQAALEDASVNPAYEQDASVEQANKAYQLAGGNLGIGLGGGTDKDVNSPLQMLTGLQGKLEGMTDAVANVTQAAADQEGGAKAAPTQKGFSTVEGSASSAANASRNWGQGRGGGGSGGSSNAFVIQNSNKNGPSKADLDALAKAGDAMADARAAMAAGVKEGRPMKFSGANFGPADRLPNERDARVGAAHRLTGRGGTELARIRKQTAQIHGNKTNAANAGGLPFLAGGQINGGMIVDGSEVTIGNSSSSDVRSTSDASIRGIRAGLANVQTGQADVRDAAKKELRSWFWTLFPAIMGMIGGILITVCIADKLPWPANLGWWIAAGVMTAAALGSIIFLLHKIHAYADICGHDGWVTWGRVLSGVLGGGVAAAWVFGLIGGKVQGLEKVLFKDLRTWAQLVVGMGAGGAGMAGYRMLADKDQYLKDIEEANKGSSSTKDRVDQETNIDGGKDK